MFNKIWNTLVRAIWFSFLFLIIAQHSIAQQQPVAISLQQAIDSTLKGNREIQLAEFEQRIADSKYKELDVVYLPQVDFSYTGMHSDNPLNVFGFKLQQQSVKASDFDPVTLNNPKGVPDFTTKLQVKQPILNLDMMYMRKAVAKQTELYALKTQRTREYLVYEVEKAYMQLALVYQQQAVLQEAKKTAEAMYLFTNDRVEAGLMQRSDALNTKVWISTLESGLADAHSNIENASDYLSLLMNKPYGTVYTVSLSAEEYPLIHESVSVSENRADFAAMTKAIEASDMAIKASKMGYYPKLNAFASYQFNDRSMFGFGSGSYLAGAQLTWDIFKGNSTRNKIATQELEKSKLSEQLTIQQLQSQLELNKTLRQFDDAKLKIAQQASSVESAAEALRILQDRYEQGLVNSTDVLMAQSQLSQQKLGLANARFNKNTTAAYIHFLTANTQQ